MIYEQVCVSARSKPAEMQLRQFSSPGTTGGGLFLSLEPLNNNLPKQLARNA